MNRHLGLTFVLLFLTVRVPANADTWEQRFPTGAPPSARSAHTAVGTGNEMIVWGGYDGTQLDSGARYAWGDNRWLGVSKTGAPAGRVLHSAVWTGTEMIIWGGGNSSGFMNTGGRYNPISDTWTAIPTVGAPAPRGVHTAVWTGSEMIVWGGNNRTIELGDGGRYNPTENRWTGLNTSGTPSARSHHTAVWTGSEIIVFGGVSGNVLNSGGRYNPAGNTWAALSASGAPAARFFHSAVWTGSEMIVWGGGDLSSYYNDGGSYDPKGDKWTALNASGTPSPRVNHTQVWTGKEMVVWGGYNYDGTATYLGDGGRYDFAGNSWQSVNTTGAPAARAAHTAVWTGSEVIVWGGTDGIKFFNDTFTYNPEERNGEAFRITSAILENGILIITFPSIAGRSYTLCQSDTLETGTWINSAVSALTGTGASLTFAVRVPAKDRVFFRVKAHP